VVEDAALAWLEALGWAVAHGPEITPEMIGAECTNYGQVILQQRLRDALATFNPALPSEARVGTLTSGWEWFKPWFDAMCGIGNNEPYFCTKTRKGAVKRMVPGQGVEPWTSRSTIKAPTIDNTLSDNDLQKQEIPGCTPGCTDLQIQAAIEALKGLDRDTLLTLLADALADKEAKA